MKTKFNINQFNPCKNGLDYYESQSDFETAWNNCERGDWMLWIAKRLDVDDRLFTLSKAHCANTVRHLMKDQRSIDAVDSAIKYGNGQISREELNKFATSAKAASDADYAAASDADYAAAATADYAAAATATATAAATTIAAAAYAAVAYVAAAADAADAASAYAAVAASMVKNQKQTADICRKYLTEEVFKKIK